MRLLADENIQQLTVEHLRALGHDIRSVKEEGLSSLRDEAVFEHAQQHKRTLLTYNADFADIRDLAEKRHHGIIRLRIHDQRVAVMHPVLDVALSQLESIDLRNTLVTVAGARVRIRHTFAL